MKPVLNVLLVDDDDTFHMIVSAIIRGKPETFGDLALHRVSDGQEALDYLAAKPPFEDRARFPMPHLVLMDERMPRLDGTDALQRIRENEATRAVPVCMLSSSEQDKLVRRAYELGANFYFVKPLKFELLEEMLAKIVDFFINVTAIPRLRDTITG